VKEKERAEVEDKINVLEERIVELQDENSKLHEVANEIDAMQAERAKIGGLLSEKEAEVESLQQLNDYH